MVKEKVKCRAKNPATCRYHGKPVSGVAHSQNGQPHKTLSIRKNGNVSEFETIFVQTLINKAQGIKETTGLADIPDTNRPKVFIGLDEEKLSEIQTSFVNKLRDELNIPEEEKLVIEYSQDNNIGNDFLVKNRNVGIEVKLGGTNDFNMGLPSVATIVGKDTMHLLPTQQDRAVWRQAYLTGNGQEIMAGLIQAEHNKKVKNFVEHVKNQSPLINPEGQTVLNNYWERKTNNSGSRANTVKLFQIDPKTNTWVADERDSKNLGEWVIFGAEYTNQKRANLYISNTQLSDVQLRLTMNYKNNYKFNNRLQAPAKLGLGTPSFTAGWIKTKPVK